MNKSYTKKQIASELNVNYSIAHGVIEFLVARGIAKANGKIETGTVGKPSTTYEIPDTFTVDFGALKITPTPPVAKPVKVKEPKVVKPKKVKVAKTEVIPVASATTTEDKAVDTTPIGVLTENPAAEPEAAEVAVETPMVSA